jgi:hypothetical protein
MKLNSWHFWGLVIIALWVMVSAAQPNFGFVAFDTAEAVGFNIGKLLFPAIGSLFLYKGYKKSTKVETPKDQLK